MQHVEVSVMKYTFHMIRCLLERLEIKGKTMLDNARSLKPWSLSIRVYYVAHIYSVYRQYSGCISIIYIAKLFLGPSEFPLRKSEQRVCGRHVEMF